VRLTGVPLLLSAGSATAVTVAVTVLLWSRYGRWRLVSRAAGVLLAEALVVVSVGLAVNRQEQFYPSWQALAGHTGTAVVTAARRAGALDAEVHGTAPAVLPRHSASLVIPAGYLSRPAVTYPVVLSLADSGAPAVAAAEKVAAIGVVATPAAARNAVPARLCRDVRATPRGWALVAGARQAALAERLIRSAPGRFVALAIVGRAAAPHGLPAETAVTVRDSWPAAEQWAAGQTSAPLAAARQLPPA
jgi:hypothetical protein